MVEAAAGGLQAPALLRFHCRERDATQRDRQGAASRAEKAVFELNMMARSRHSVPVSRLHARRTEFRIADFRPDPDRIHLRPSRRVRSHGDRQSQPLRSLSGAALADVRCYVQDYPGAGTPVRLYRCVLRRLRRELCRGICPQPFARTPRRQCQYRGTGCRLQQCGLHGNPDVSSGVRPGERPRIDHRHPVHRLACCFSSR
jgi:hypothetical protein